MPYDEQRLTDIFRTVFNQPALVLTDTLTAHDVPGWDSFNHVNLIVTIEAEFNVRFTTDEATSLANVGELGRLLKHKLQSE